MTTSNGINASAIMTEEYPKTYAITVYKTDFGGRSTGEVSFKYCQTVNDSEESRKFYESFDNGDAKVTRIA